MTRTPWMKRLAAGAATLAVPLAVLAHGPASACPPPLPMGGAAAGLDDGSSWHIAGYGPPNPGAGGPAARLPPGMFPGAPPSGPMPPHWRGPAFAPPPDGPPPGVIPPHLQALELTDDQQDKVFALLHADMPREREQRQKAARATHELRALAAAERFDADQARALAETTSRAMAEVALMQAARDAKVRALLTPEQRRRFDDASREPWLARPLTHRERNPR